MTRELEQTLRRIAKETPQFADGAEVVATVVKTLRKQGRLPEKLPEQTQPKLAEKPQDILSAAIVEFKKGPLTPELVTKTFPTIWQVRGESIGRTFEVVSCPYTKEELAEIEQEGRRVGFLPQELATQKDRHLLGQVWPKMTSRSVEKGNSVTNEVNYWGWFDYEVAIDAPYLNTNEQELREQIAAEGREGMNATEYIVASQDSKLFTGWYFDEVRTWVRLLGSRDESQVVGADFGSDGRLHVNWSLSSGHRHPRLGGGRSVGVSKAYKL